MKTIATVVASVFAAVGTNSICNSERGLPASVDNASAMSLFLIPKEVSRNFMQVHSKTTVVRPSGLLYTRSQGMT